MDYEDLWNLIPIIGWNRPSGDIQLIDRADLQSIY